MSFFHANTFWRFYMNLRKYEAFASVISLGSLTRAAEALGCTQSAVSHMINSLENELGFRLLIRSRHGVKLTADGEKALPAVLAVLDSNEPYTVLMQVWCVSAPSPPLQHIGCPV